MASFDYRLNPIRAIKECSSCGACYTADFCCSKEGLEDKVLVPIPESSQQPIIIEKICFDCGDLVRGLYCRECALIRKTLEEVFQNLQDTSRSSDDNTNVVNAPREPIVVKQDPGENSSPSPPQIDHCCHECGDSLDGIFCRQCTCKSCGKGAHYGYNCPTKVPIITNPEPCNTQTISEPLQNLQSLQQQCLFRTCQQCGCNEYDGVCFYCKVGNGTPINVSTPYSSNDSPSVANHPPQSQYVPYSSIQKKEEEKRIAEEQASKDQYWKIPICYDDDEDDTIAITPVLPIEEPDNSLSMGDEHLDTIPATESDEVIKSSVEDLVPIPSESEGIPDKMCDVPLCEIHLLNALKMQHSEIVVNYDDVLLQVLTILPYGRGIDYVKASPPDFPPADRSNFNHEEFADELTHIMPLPKLECFKFKIEPDPGDLTSIDPGIRKNVSTTNVNVPFVDFPDCEDSRFYHSLELHILSFI
ncbi:hypothetical protein Tco_0567753 [Tanacetum coccineum]